MPGATFGTDLRVLVRWMLWFVLLAGVVCPLKVTPRRLAIPAELDSYYSTTSSVALQRPPCKKKRHSGFVQNTGSERGLPQICIQQDTCGVNLWAGSLDNKQPGTSCRHYDTHGVKGTKCVLQPVMFELVRCYVADCRTPLHTHYE